ncbi:hypothetical protein CAPI_04210 [Corynebacterium capitovis DSM 44611]|uniref:hypothetical protein n=1 Tax=Corynebacterium capitovis TaxID=131081 RepID=UPI00037B0026|nr:hypothetical protein [Corynebacterium capitovis]WKD57400.1 hypothetical protein CAPI_04210 [Corynebacterium capitovis DSM 44611]
MVSTRTVRAVAASSATALAFGAVACGSDGEADNGSLLTSIRATAVPQTAAESSGEETTGTPVDDADLDEMQRAVYLTMNPGSYDGWTRVLLENSCHKVADPIWAEMERSGTTLEQLEKAARLQARAGQGVELPHTEVSLHNVHVDGERATATVTAVNSRGTQTQTQIFAREDGRWKLCS